MIQNRKKSGLAFNTPSKFFVRVVATLCQRDWKCTVTLEHEMRARHTGGEGELHLNERREETIRTPSHPVLAYRNKNEITHHTHHTAFE